MKIATHRLEFLLYFLRENTRTEAENANEHAPYASFFKREAGIKIATYQFIKFPLYELIMKTHEPKWETQMNIRKRTKKR